MTHSDFRPGGFYYRGQAKLPHRTQDTLLAAANSIFSTVASKSYSIFPSAAIRDTPGSPARTEKMTSASRVPNGSKLRHWFA